MGLLLLDRAIKCNAAGAYVVFNIARSIVACCLTLASFIVLVIGLSMNVNLAHFGGALMEGLMFFALSFLLFINEGYQIALFGVRNMHLQDLEKFPHALKIRRFMFEDGSDKQLRLFFGQTFQVVFSTFLISQLATFTHFPAISHIPDGLVSFFVRSGFSGVVFTVNISQLLPSLIAQKYPAEFLNVMPLVLPVIRIALFIETIGVAQATHFIVRAFELFFGVPHRRPQISTPSVLAIPSESDSSSSSPAVADHSTDISCYRQWWVLLYSPSGVKTTLSVGITAASVIFIIYNISKGYSAVELHPTVLIILMGVLYTVFFYCEGLKIAVIGSGHFTRKELVEREYSTVIHDILARQDDGIARFLLGRQMICLSTGFFVASITLFESYENLNPMLYFLLAGLGLPGMLVTMQIARLAPQILASRHTKQFLSIYGGTAFVLLSLFVELFGITQCAYVIRGVVERVCPCKQQPLVLTSFCSHSTPTTDTVEPSVTTLTCAKAGTIVGDVMEPFSPLVCGSAVGVTLSSRDYYYGESSYGVEDLNEYRLINSIEQCIAPSTTKK